MEGTVKLIDANAEELQSRINRFFKKGTQRFIIRTILKDVPAVDALPVVRCETRLYRSQYCDENGMYKCGGIQSEDGNCFYKVAPNFFCAFGERRGNERNID